MRKRMQRQVKVRLKFDSQEKALKKYSNNLRHTHTHTHKGKRKQGAGAPKREFKLKLSNKLQTA